jgi:uncharacterized protein YkwD
MRFIFLFPLVLFSVLIAQPDDARLSSHKTIKISEVNTNLNKELMLRLVNEKRTAGCNCGNKYMPAAPALVWNNTIALAALGHSQDMDNKRFFDHNSSNGKNLRDRFDAVGYKWMAIAENIAFGQKNEYDVVNAWFKSKGHCENLMNPVYKEMGAAKVGIYWTQDFGTKRNW